MIKTYKVFYGIATDSLFGMKQIDVIEVVKARDLASAFKIADKEATKLNNDRSRYSMVFVKDIVEVK